MSYAIGNIVLGTHIPDDKKILDQLDVIYFALEPQENEDQADYFREVVLDAEHFTTCYEGSSLAYVGVELGQIDETETIPFGQLMKFAPTQDQLEEADQLWRLLPVDARRILPQFSVYIVWSSS